MALTLALRATDEVVASELGLWTPLKRSELGGPLLLEGALAGELGLAGRVRRRQLRPYVVLVLGTARVLQHDLLFKLPRRFPIERSNDQNQKEGILTAAEAPSFFVPFSTLSQRSHALPISQRQPFLSCPHPSLLLLRSDSTHVYQMPICLAESIL